MKGKQDLPVPPHKDTIHAFLWKIPDGLKHACFSSLISTRQHPVLKGTVHPKMKNLSSFTQPQVVTNLHESICSEHKRKIFWRMRETEPFWGTIDFNGIFCPTMEVNGAPKQPGYKLSSKYLPLCSAEQRNSYRFGTTWGWVNDDNCNFGWTVPLRKKQQCFLQGSLVSLWSWLISQRHVCFRGTTAHLSLLW